MIPMSKLRSILTSKRTWLALVSIILTAVFIRYQQSETKKNNYTTTLPEYRSISQSLEVSGVIDAKKHVSLHFPAIARLSWVGVAEGQWVNRWQPVAAVDTRTLEKQLQQDFNTFEKQWRVHDQNLDDVDFYSDSGLTDEFKRIAEKSHFDLENTALNVEIRDLAIRLSSLVSPIDGLVVRIDTPFAGTNITPADIFEIVDPSTIYFTSVVDEEDISLIKVGLEVDLVIDAYRDETLDASVSAVKFTPSQSESGGTGYVVEVSFPVSNQNLKYKLGMNGTASILLNAVDQAQSIPVDCLIYRDDVAYVDIWENGQVVRKEVETGVESDEYVEIKSGLGPADQVIVPDGEDTK
jgi:HlyD family secretion protein